MDDRRHEESIEIEITDVLDLHSFPPGETASVVESYLEAAIDKGLNPLRIIHGRGIGAQRLTVRKALSRHPGVISFADAPPEAGGWGATVVVVRTGEGREP